MARQKIRIRLKAYDHRILDQSAEQIVEAAERTGAAVAGPIPLPTEIKKFCVIRSPFVTRTRRSSSRSARTSGSSTSSSRRRRRWTR